MENRNYWQQASGDGNRSYADICLKWDVILNGPGDVGRWPECKETLKNAGRSKKVTDLQRFAEDMKHGDVIVLRNGTSEISGVGIIQGNYNWLDIFGDIDGWDIQHVRRVKWLWKGKKQFEKYTLKLGDTTQKLDSEAVKIWVDSLSLDFNTPVTLQELPEHKDYSIKFETVSEYLFNQGISSTSIDILNKEIDELVRIAKWYQKDNNPSESETIAYLAVPLLRALGWTPQKMAIEWRNVDIALFSQLPRQDSNLSVVVEVKRKDRSCLTAFSQAQAYSEGEEISNCNRLIVTDGLRYGIYTKDESKKEFQLYAYFNITKLKEYCPIYDCYGVKEALKVMAPEWNNA